MDIDYNALKVADLKNLVKERGITATGLSRKQQYIDALQVADQKSLGEGPLVAEGDGADTAVQNEDAGAAEAETGLEAEKVEAAVAETNTVGEDDDMTGEMQDDAAPPSATTQQQTAVGKANEPISQEPSQLATPQQSSLVPEDASSDTKKRKRRSPTPPLTEESVSKKLKAAEEEPVKLPEDEIVAEAPVPLEPTTDATMEGEEKIQSYGSSDDVMPVSHPAHGEPAEATDVTMHDNTTTHPAEPPDGALHPATRALYIRDLIRPLQPTQLRDHLATLSTSPAALENFHLDVLRTHAFALFTSVSDAVRVRAALHGTVFPDEPTRKPLWVDFVPAEKAGEWMEVELREGGSRRDAKRWEVVYDVDDTADGGVRVSFEEVGGAGGVVGRQGSLNQAPTQPASATPQAPRNNTTRPSEQPPPHTDEHSKPTPAPAPAEPEFEAETEPAEPTSFSLLDQRFTSTTTKPKLYYLPQPAALAAARLEALRNETSRDWDGGRAEDFEAGGGAQQLRRYTFEDGDRYRR
ncbi:hypothetical protein BAUCODRAFT_392171 [Baudoinia panamericana UAMH 10762]|uniref:SAP domain-containing protein n=1 Tax=Baudoinia panamericana (strain UAMH 10762) TaxID=717646 RepID=M2NJ36_BAUPA|nr:uncharacterized protein BAUCODRAFT_392171 [Baudoinia panamericana UAMH 10762]EMC99125.1 hypothetical protein BAUCODRAFT_392171 [Baudoinia panamericana UAMH 10762]